MLARARDDPSAFEAILADDVLWEVGAIHIPGMEADYHGRAGVLDFFRQWIGAFSEWGYAFDDITEAGDCVIVHIHQWGVGKASGARVDNEFWQVWKLRGGKAVRGTNHRTRDEALAAVQAP